MPLLTTTPRISAAIAIYNALPSTTTSVPTTPSIPHTTLLHISRLLSIPPSRLLHATTLYTPPPPPPPPKSPEYIRLMSRLRAAELNGAYAPQKGEEEEEMTWKEVKSQVTAIMNVLLTTVASAVAVWRVAGDTWEAGARLGLAMGAALVVLVAEVVLFWGFVRRMGEVKGLKGEASVGGEGEVVRRWEVGVGGVTVLGKVGAEEVGGEVGDTMGEKED